MKFLPIVLISGFCATFAAGLRAEIYSCKDATGHTISSDRPIPECLDRAVKVRRNNGQYQRDIPPALSAEERRQAQIEQEKQKNAELAEENRLKEERFLLAHYRSENDIELMRGRSLDALKERIRLGKEQTAAVSQLLLQLQAEQPGNAKKSATEAAALHGRAVELEQSIKKSKIINDAYEKEQIRINSQFDDTLKHYREIVESKKK